MAEKPTYQELEQRSKKLEQAEVECKQAEEALHKNGERLSNINDCFLNFTPDALENICRLTALCGTFFGATCALYNRLEKGLLYSWGQWNTPPDFIPADRPEGHICHDVIRNASDQVLVVSNLQETSYARTDPNVVPFKLQTYIGKAVKFSDTYRGALCVVFQDDFVPSETDLKFLGILAAAIGVEEERRQAQEALKESEERFSLFMDYLPAIVFIKNADSQAIYVNKHMNETLGAKDWIGKNALELFPKDTAEAMQTDDRQAMAEGYQMSVESVPDKNGTNHIYQTHKFKIERTGKRPLLGGIALDITERNKAENEIRKAKEKLEAKVRERTASLEEMNAALHVLLKKREQDKDDIEGKILSNVKILISPCLQALKKCALNNNHKELVQILETNIDEIVSPFTHKLSALNINLSPMEIQVANLVRQGKTNKEISEILAIAVKTVAFHRHNIRRKLGLTNTKANLRSFLSALP